MMYRIGSMLRYEPNSSLCLVIGYRPGAFEDLYIIQFISGHNPKEGNVYSEEWNSYEMSNFFSRVS
jgi:hypothetical protein